MKIIKCRHVPLAHLELHIVNNSIFDQSRDKIINNVKYKKYELMKPYIYPPMYLERMYMTYVQDPFFNKQDKNKYADIDKDIYVEYLLLKEDIYEKIWDSQSTFFSEYGTNPIIDDHNHDRLGTYH